MKDIFDKLGASIKNTCKEAMDQTQKTVDQTKYRTEILSLKNELKKLYQQLGERYYKELIGEDEVRDYTNICKRITGMRKEIARLEGQVGSVVNEQKDSFESYKRHVKNTWQEEEDAKRHYEATYQEVKTYKFCENCNVGNPVDADYCVNCGEKF